MRSDAIWVPAENPSDSEIPSRDDWPEWLGPILARRGVGSAADAQAFLQPTVDQLHDPLLLPDMEPAAERLAAATKSAETIAIVGDYDVDGVSATALLTAVFRALGSPVIPILPHRMKDGYGFQVSHAERAAAEGASVVVTADCGSTSFEAVEAALAAGLDVVVSDHHLTATPLAAGALHVNPKRAESTYPFPDLCGAGIAFKLASAVADRVGKPIEPTRLLRMAALGTIADVVPLRGENRVIAALGLRALEGTTSLGLRALMGVARTKLPLTAVDVGFRIGPRLNAAGRMDSPDPALELLLTRDAARAEELAETLDRHNRTRRQAELLVVDEAREAVLERGELPSVLVASSPSWHRGVVGIAAGRLAKEFHRPTLLLSDGGETATGSGRSVRGIDLHGFFSGWAEQLERFGGHAQAIGMTIDRSRLDSLTTEWEKAAAESFDPELLRPRYVYDAQLDAAKVDHTLLRHLSSLEPCGAGNPQPLFRLGPVKRARPPRHFGDSHVSMRVADTAGDAFDIVAWRWRDRIEELPEEFDVLGYFELDGYTGQPVLRLADARPAENGYS